MELWIRSQNKKRLLEIDDIGIVDYNGYYYVVGYKNGNEVKLGKYEFHSATRALEVLDEIQKFIMSKEEADYKTNIYEMPLD